MSSSHTESVRRAGLVLVAGALITTAGGAVSQIVQQSTDVSDDLWRYPWTSDVFVAVTLLWALAHVLVIVGLAGLRRSAIAGRSRGAAAGLALAIAGTALLVVGEFASLPIAGEPVDATLPGIVGAVYGLGSLLSGIGLIVAGKATIEARRWDDWRRFTPLVAGGWTIVLTGMAMTKALPTGVAVYGLCLLAIGIAMYTRPSPAPADAVAPRARAAA